MSDTQGAAVVAGAPFGIATLGADGGVVSANPALLDLLGAPASDVQGRPLVGLVPARDRGTVVAALAGLNRGQRRATAEHRVVRADNTEVWCRSTWTRPVGTAQTTMYIEDITAQRDAVLQLRETERQYRAAFEGSPIGQAVCTLDGLVLHANRALARMLGIDVASLLGRRLNDLALDRSPISEQDLVGLVRGSVASLEAERRFRHASGGEVFVHLHLTLRRDRTGQPSELLVGVTDVTRRREAERERAAALTRLEDALADLERSNGDLEHFASVASHDLRAPLASVIGFLRTLEHQEAESLSARARTYVGAALSGAVRMESMMRALLEYAGRNRAPLAITPVDTREIVDGVVAALASTIAEADATVRTGPLPVVHADRASLDIVVQNLVANAIKFRRPGVDPVITISARSVGETWHLRVEDNGIGVPAGQREAIFEMFGRRAEASDYDGHGIGLATVARAVERHDGRVWVEEGVDGGACFVVALPRRNEVAADEGGTDRQRAGTDRQHAGTDRPG